MLLIRGDTRVAEIYMTEFDSVFRHFCSRNVINDVVNKGRKANLGALDPTDKWSADYFGAGNAKCHKRKMFFQSTADAWPAKATKDADVFKGERTAGT